MNILIYRNQLLQEVTKGAYFCDISNSTNWLFPPSQRCIHASEFDQISHPSVHWTERRHKHKHQWDPHQK